MITVFTPTYNRKYIIGKLYESLCSQTCQNFEWVIVDDGSTDGTKGLISSFISEQKIAIRYIKKTNGGKHRAINSGLQEARGELFFIVDSDDALASNAIERIIYHYSNVKDKSKFAGICGLKAHFSGEKISGEPNFEVLDCSSLEFRFKHKMKGDMAEVFKTDILKKYPFPEIPREKFCPEALIWNRIASKYKLRYFNEKIYLCDYLPDGLTAKIVRIRMKSPEASKMYYSELYHTKIPYIQKVKAAINYWRFAFNSFKSFRENIKPIGIFSILVIPISSLLYLNDLRK